MLFITGTPFAGAFARFAPGIVVDAETWFEPALALRRLTSAVARFGSSVEIRGRALQAVAH